MFGKSKKQDGFIALISILIIGAVILSVSLGIAFRSLSETNMSFGEQESHRALALAGACAEKALLKLESVLHYTGNETIMIGGRPCDILEISGSGNSQRTIRAQATSTIIGYTYVRKIKLTIPQIIPMEITSWQEVTDF